MLVKRRSEAHCDDCGGTIPKGTPLVSQRPTSGVPRRAVHRVCPGAEDLVGLGRIGEGLLAVVDDVERRAADPDTPVDLVPVRRMEVVRDLT